MKIKKEYFKHSFLLIQIFFTFVIAFSCWAEDPKPFVQYLERIKK